jgi:hypothetical protein
MMRLSGRIAIEDDGDARWSIVHRREYTGLSSGEQAGNFLSPEKCRFGWKYHPLIQRIQVQNPYSHYLEGAKLIP